MPRESSNVIPFPSRPPRRPASAPDSAPEEAEPIRRAARAGTAAAGAIAEILGRHAKGATPDMDLSASKAANAGVLWGAVLGVARCHGQIPALAALERIAERLRDDPQGLITGPQHQPGEDEAAQAVRALLG